VPKELTHWMIARATAAKVDAQATPRTAAAVRACPEAFLLGAVAHDGPFYWPGDPRMTALGDHLHGKGVDVGDGYAPIKRALATGRDDVPAAAIAFMAGALTHMAADTVFHPAVFYFTGFANHPQRHVSEAYLYRHRAFEAAMDLDLLPSHGQGLERKLTAVIARANARPDADDLWSAVARFYAHAAPPSPVEALRIVRRAGKTQALFFSSPARLVAKVLGFRRAETNADVSSLFYTTRRRWRDGWCAARPYRDPVTGDEGHFDLGEFFGRALGRALSLWTALERALDGDATAFAQPGPCLDSGRPVGEERPMRYCDPTL
jgi:hypothetical protein